MNKNKVVILTISITVAVAILTGTLCALLLGGDDNPFTGTEPVTTAPQWGILTYEEYNALSAEEQESYFNSFATTEEFFDWYNLAKQEYEDAQDRVEIDGDGDLDVEMGTGD